MPGPDVEGYRDLLVWQKAMDVVVRCYQLTRSFPPDERFGLTSQLQRTAVSVPANIAEGHGRRSTKEYLYHLRIAHGSLMELETHLQIGGRLGYVPDDELLIVLGATEEIGRMLNGLHTSLERRLASS